MTLVQKAEVVVTRDGVTQRQELPGNLPVFYADGSDVSILEVLVNHIVREQTHNHGQWEELLHRKKELYGERDVRYIATAHGPSPRSNGQKVYIKGISHSTGQEELFEIADVAVTFEAKWSVADVPLTHGEYDGTYFSTGSAALGDANTVQLVYTETPEGELDVAGRLDGTVASLGLDIAPKRLP